MRIFRRVGVERRTESSSGVRCMTVIQALGDGYCAQCANIFQAKSGVKSGLGTLARSNGGRAPPLGTLPAAFFATFCRRLQIFVAPDASDNCFRAFRPALTIAAVLSGASATRRSHKSYPPQLALPEQLHPLSEPQQLPAMPEFAP